MLDLLIKLIITLGLQFGFTDTGQIQMTDSDLKTLTNSEIYQREGSPSVDKVTTVSSNTGDCQDAIVVIPEVDPTATN